MRVRVDDEASAGLLGHLGVHVVEIEPLRLGVDLEQNTRVGGGAGDPGHVDRIGIAAPQQPSRRVGEDAHVRMAQGPEDPFGHRLFSHVELGVHRDHHDVERAERLLVQVETAVGQDIHLGALEDGDAAVPAPDLLDDAYLAAEPCPVHPPGHPGRRSAPPR